MILDFAQLLAVVLAASFHETNSHEINCHESTLTRCQLANPWVPASQTMKIKTAKTKTAKISETQILACFAKICTRKNYQPYGTELMSLQREKNGFCVHLC